MRKQFRKSKISRLSLAFLSVGIISVFTLTLATNILAPKDADAANLVVSRTGLANMGAASVQLSETVALNSETFRSGNQNIALKQSYRYTADDVANGRFMSDKASHDYVTYAGNLQANAASTGPSDYFVTYTGGVAGNSSVSINDAFSVRYPRKVFDADNNIYDLILYFRNVKIENRSTRAITKPVGLFNGRSLSAWTALQEATSQQELNSRSSINSSIIRNHGVEMTVEARIVAAGTENTISGKYVPFRWTDLDVYDLDASGHATYGGTYVESIMLANGVYGNVFVEPDTLLNIGSSTYGANTSFRATVSDDNTVRSGVAYLANSASSTFVWRGRDCATTMGLLRTSTITTSRYGNYASHATIDATDNAVLWKEDKTVNMSADSGYYINEVKVDNAVVYSGTNQNKTTHQYSFSSVMENHTVAVSVARKQGTTTIHHYVDGSATKLYEDTIVNGNLGDSFDCSQYIQNTNPKYELASQPSASQCVIGENGYTISMSYRKKSGTINVRYIDQDSGEEILAGGDSYTGIVDETKTISAREFERYLLTNEEAEVEMTYGLDAQEVIFYYRKLWRITTHYIDYDNPSSRLAEDLVEEEFLGTTYTSAPVNIDHYILYKEPATKDYVFGGEDQEINYYYRRRASIMIRYIDVATGKEIRKAVYDDDGYSGKAFTCKAFIIPGYDLVTPIETADCVYSADGTEIIVRYRKKQNETNPSTTDQNPLPNVILASSLGVVSLFLLAFVIKRR